MVFSSIRWGMLAFGKNRFNLFSVSKNPILALLALANKESDAAAIVTGKGDRCCGVGFSSFGYLHFRFLKAKSWFFPPRLDLFNIHSIKSY